MADGSSKKRIGAHGKFKKSLQNLYSRANTPSILMAYSDGSIVGEGSNDAMNRFVADERVKKIFLEYASQEPIIQANIQEQQQQQKALDEDSMELPENWLEMNCLHKRDWIVKVVTWCNHGKVNWTKEDCKPTWWPVDVTFRSPNNKSDRPDVSQMDKILKGFMKHQGILEMEDACQQSTSLWDSVADLQSFEELVTTSNEIVEQLNFQSHFIKNCDKLPKELELNDIAISVRKYVPRVLQREPVQMEGSNNFLKSLSHSLDFPANWQLLKCLSVTGLVTHVEDLTVLISDGGLGLPKKFLNEAGLSVEEDIKDLVLRCLKDDIAILDMIGLHFALDFDFILHCEADEVYYFEECSRLNRRFHVLYKPSFSNLSILLSSDLVQEDVACAHNMWCKSTGSEGFTSKCKHCLLTYHADCINGVDNCRCDEEFSEKRFDWLFCVDKIERRLNHFKQQIKTWVTNILLNRSITCRINAVCKMLVDGDRNLVDSLNKFYEDIPQPCVNAFLSHVKKILIEETAIDDIIVRRYSVDHREEIIRSMVYPEVAKLLMMFNDQNSKPTDIMIERKTHKMAHVTS